MKRISAAMIALSLFLTGLTGCKARPTLPGQSFSDSSQTAPVNIPESSLSDGSAETGLPSEESLPSENEQDVSEAEKPVPSGTAVSPQTVAEAPENSAAPPPDSTPAETSGESQTSSSEQTVPTVPETDARQQVFELVNGQRALNGAQALAYRTDLQDAADLRARELIQSFSHTRPDGTDCFTVFSEFGVSYRTAGENIAWGQPTAEAVMNSWMNSDGHRNNILSESFTGIAVGLAEAGGRKYWVQLFIR